MAAVSRMLEYIFGACVTGRSEDGGRTAHELVCVGQLALVLRCHVGKAKRVFAASQDRRAAVGGRVGTEVSSNGERRARGRGHHDRILPGRATLEKPLVD
eukprot:4256962-Pleurochrysis_carterae.AAC.2